MARIFLQDMVDQIQFDTLPASWNSFHLATFSKTKRLWDYQQKAIENAIKVLWKYYEDFADYRPGESLETNQERKSKLLNWYTNNGQNANLDIRLDKINRNIRTLLTKYYETENNKIPYAQMMNRMCFWMATGSGKTLILIKLVQILKELIRRNEIPPHDILVLTHRDDLIEQLKKHVEEFNHDQSDSFIRLRELKEYEAVKREHPFLFREQEITIFYYRSDNISDEQKEKIIDFRNYDDQGKWYLFLDEAHKGDKEDSKRQHIYSILSRNGFLFNFSATFTDPRDLITTVVNFNLAEFIKRGYGKHIAILKQEVGAFKDTEDYNNEEKQKIVLKSLLMLTYVKKCFAEIGRTQGDLYHKPLLLTLVNSVNTDDADLKLFFRELERIGRGELSEAIWEQAKDELGEEMKQRPVFMFEENQHIEIDEAAFQNLSKKDILKMVYNAESSGEIEILVRPSNRQELAFKLRTSDHPFALIKIGDISGWLKNELTGYELIEGFTDEGFFERLNTDETEINILMGSRSFYEGWDSNRPNVINFINIGTATDAKKFILQSVGRGVRIEPVKNKRKRLLPLYNAGEVGENLFFQIKNRVSALETLFIFGTNRNALETVIGHLDQENEKEKQQQLSLFINEEANNRQLLIPIYKQADHPLMYQRKLTKFVIAPDELDLLKKYIEFIQDDRVLLAMYETEPKKIGVLRASLNDPENYYEPKGKSFQNLNLLTKRIFDYFGILPEELDQLKELTEEIRHFKNIKVSLQNIIELQNKVEKVRNYPILVRELQEQYGRIPAAEYIKKAQSISDRDEFKSNGKSIKIKYITNHYYIPLILSKDEKIDYIKHIIKNPSEVKFIHNLERYLAGDNKFKEFDWWLFSKLDESLDEVYIPYYNPKLNQINRFKPDFIFWLQKGDDYFIVFIDPKGTEHTDYEHKIDGYRRIFEDTDCQARILVYKELKVRVFTFLYTPDVHKLSTGYKKYWFDKIDQAIECLLGRS